MSVAALAQACREGAAYGYLAAKGFHVEVRQALGDSLLAVYGDLFLARGPLRLAPFAQNIWYHVELLNIQSIGEAVRALRSRQRNWWYVEQDGLNRRMALIQEQLPKIDREPVHFPAPPRTAPLGSYTLLDANTLLLAKNCLSSYPNGLVDLVQDHVNPPSRAYLKLCEALLLYGTLPQRGERCLDLGAAPGGWTYVLDSLGCSITAIDRAPLDARLMHKPNIRYLKQDAFSFKPDTEEQAWDWLFSDVICYPDKLLALVQAWLASGKVRHLIVTIKFQGPTNHDVIAGFAGIPGGRLMHLSYNKHELTFMI